MIIKKGKNIEDIIRNGYRLQKVYSKRYLIWSKDGGDIHSCFGGGYWINSLPWDNKDAWKNNQN
jgi:hypothetical protein